MASPKEKKVDAVEMKLHECDSTFVPISVGPTSPSPSLASDIITLTRSSTIPSQQPAISLPTSRFHPPDISDSCPSSPRVVNLYCRYGACLLLHARSPPSIRCLVRPFRSRFAVDLRLTGCSTRPCGGPGSWDRRVTADLEWSPTVWCREAIEVASEIQGQLYARCFLLNLPPLVSSDSGSYL